jgi:hypothetical protein
VGAGERALQVHILDLVPFLVSHVPETDRHTRLDLSDDVLCGENGAKPFVPQNPRIVDENGDAPKGI